MITYANQNLYQFNGSAALNNRQPVLHKNQQPLKVVLGSNKSMRANRYDSHAYSYSSERSYILTSRQIIGSYICMFATLAVVMFMYIFLG